MARREAYSPLLKSYPDSDKVNALSIGAETLYTRLIAASDDAGRYYGDAAWVLARLFTSRMLNGQVTEADVEKWLCELESVTLAIRYRAAHVSYLELVGVFKKLRTDVKPQLIYPSPVPASVTPRSASDTSRNESETPRSESVPLEPTTEPNQTNPEPRAVPFLIPLPRSLDQPEFERVWKRWMQYLVNKNHGRVAQDTLESQLTEFAKLGVRQSVEIIEYAILKGHAGPVWPNERHGPKPARQVAQLGDE